MSEFVLDCSVAMAWCFEDEASDYTDHVLSVLPAKEAKVPLLWYLEVSNVLLMAERYKRITEADSTRFLELVRALPIVIDEEQTSQNIGSVVALGREYGLTAYDAAYLELAMRQGLPLATKDKKLRSVCEKCGVSLFAAM